MSFGFAYNTNNVWRYHSNFPLFVILPIFIILKHRFAIDYHFHISQVKPVKKWLYELNIYSFKIEIPLTEKLKSGASVTSTPNPQKSNNFEIRINIKCTPTYNSAAYMCQWIGSEIDKIMACCLFGTKPLSKAMLGYCQVGLLEQTSVKFYSQIQSKSKIFYSPKCFWKHRLRSGGHFVQGEIS